MNDVSMPLSEAMTCTDGTIVDEIPVPAGTTIAIGILPCNRNLEIWGEDVLDFKP